MALLDLFLAATMPVIKVLLMTSVGSLLATSHFCILTEEARKHLNNVVFYVFNPALVNSVLSETITFKSMVLLWFAPFNILLNVIIGSAFGWLLNRATKPPSHLKGLILGCCAAGNHGNLLLIMVPAICKEKGSPFGDPDTCSTYGLAYVSLSMAIGSIFLWSYVYNIVRESSCRSIDEDLSETAEASKLLPNDSEIQTSCVEDCLGPCTSVLLTKHNLPTRGKYRQAVEKFSEKFHLKKLFAPSTFGVIVGFTVGVITPLRKILIGADAPLRVIHDSITLLGDGAIPMLTLILGGNLVKGLRGSEIQMSYIIGILLVRYIFLPLSGILVVRGAYHLGLVHSDPLYQFVLLIQFAVPPAMNIGTLTQLFKAGESECSVIFLWTYALSALSLTLWSTFYMWLVS